MKGKLAFGIIFGLLIVIGMVSAQDNDNVNHTGGVSINITLGPRVSSRLIDYQVNVRPILIHEDILQFQNLTLGFMNNDSILRERPKIQSFLLNMESISLAKIMALHNATSIYYNDSDSVFINGDTDAKLFGFINVKRSVSYEVLNNGSTVFHHKFWDFIYYIPENK